MSNSVNCCNICISVQWQYRDHLGGQLTMFNSPWRKLALFNRTMVVIIIVIKIMMMMMKKFQFSTLISVSHFSSGFLRMHANISLCFECLTFYSKQRTTCSLSHSTGFVVVVVAFLCCCSPCCCFHLLLFSLLLFLLLLRRNNGTTGSLSHSTGCEELGVGCDGHKELGVKRLHFSENVLQCGDNSMRIQHNTKKQAPKGFNSSSHARPAINSWTTELYGMHWRNHEAACNWNFFSALASHALSLPPSLSHIMLMGVLQPHQPPSPTHPTHAPSWQILKKLKPAVCLFEWVQEIAPPTQTNQPPPPPTHAFHTPISFLLPWLDFHGIHSHQHNNGVSIHIRSTRIFIITSLWFQRDQ